MQSFAPFFENASIILDTCIVTFPKNVLSHNFSSVCPGVDFVNVLNDALVRLIVFHIYLSLFQQYYSKNLTFLWNIAADKESSLINSGKYFSISLYIK